MRLPVEKRFVRRCERNATALWELHEQAGVANDDIPAFLFSAEVDGTRFFVEEWLPGRAVDEPSHTFDALVERAWQRLLVLHHDTEAKTELSELDFARLIEPMLTDLGLVCRTNAIGNEAVQRIHAFLREALIGARIPLVRMHGDYKLENVLFSESFSVTGVIDWDLSVDNGLPLVDVLHLAVHRTRVMEAISTNRVVIERLVPWSMGTAERSWVGRYLAEFAIKPALLLPLIIVYWLHRVTRRLELHMVVDRRAVDRDVRAVLPQIGAQLAKGSRSGATTLES